MAKAFLELGSFEKTLIILLVVAAILSLFAFSGNPKDGIVIENNLNSKNSNHIENLSKDEMCEKDIYNCSDFSTLNRAQSVYLECGGKKNDVHRLDLDKDGIPCESLKKL